MSKASEACLCCGSAVVYKKRSDIDALWELLQLRGRTVGATNDKGETRCLPCLSSPRALVTAKVKTAKMVKARVAFSGKIQKLVKGAKSSRGARRILGLALGLQGDVQIETLRAAAQHFGCYNPANFSMDIKKEEALGIFKRRQKGGRLLSFSLTPKGRQYAEDLLSA